MIPLFYIYKGVDTGRCPYSLEGTYLEFDKGPKTLIGPGECTDDLIFVSASSGLIEPHQIWA